MVLELAAHLEDESSAQMNIARGLVFPQANIPKN